MARGILKELLKLNIHNTYIVQKISAIHNICIMGVQKNFAVKVEHDKRLT